MLTINIGDDVSTWIENCICKKCKTLIIVTQADEKDYLYYCANKKCENHIGTECFHDEEYPDWMSKADNYITII